MASIPTSRSESAAARGWSRCGHRLAIGLALVAVGLSVAVLVVWALGDWAALTVAGGAPMAPSTALLSVFLGVALLLRLGWPERPSGHRFGGVAAGLTVAGVLDVVFENLAGRLPLWERLLNSIGSAPPGPSGHYEMAGRIVVGSMAPITGGLLVLAAAALVLPFPMGNASRWRRLTGLGCGLLGAGLATLPLLAHLAGAPLVAGCGILSFPLPTAIVLLCLTLALLLAAGAGRWLRELFSGAPEAEAGAMPLRDRLLLAGLAALGLAIVVLSMSYLHFSVRAQRQEGESELGSVLARKSQQIEQWRQERLGDAQMMMRTPGVGRRLQALVDDPSDAAARQELKTWLQQFTSIHGYGRLVLLDREMRPLLAVPDAGGMDDPGLKAQLRPLLPYGGLIELDPYVDAAGQLCLDLLAPLPSAPGEVPSGAILLQTDPERSLLPLVREEPARRASAENLLWWRDGDRWLGLGGSCERAGVPTELRRPLAQVRPVAEPDFDAALVARGERRLVESLDWRGVPTLGLGAPIPGSSWILVAKMDRAEIDTSMRAEALKIGAAMVALLLIAGLALALVWRQRDNLLQKRRLATRLGLVMRHANDVIMILDERMHVVEVNDRALDLYGCSREELLRRTIRDFRVPEAMPLLERDLAEVRRPGGALFETVHRGKDGKPVPVEISNRMVEIEGRPHLLAVIRDITERRRMADELRRSEERYRLIAENTFDMIWIADLETGKFTYVSPASRRVRGLAPEELVGRSMTESLSPAAQRRVAEAFPARVAAFNAGDENARHHSDELELVRPDGAVLQIEVVTTLMADATGRAASLLGITRDITARKLAERALRESEERYRLIAENTSDTIWLCDLGSRHFTYISSAAERLFGYAREEQRELNLMSLLAPASAGEAERTLRERITALAAGDEAARHHTARYEVVRRDGSTIVCEIVTSILCDASGWPTQLLGVTRDITERVQADAKLHESEARYRYLFEHNPAPMLIYERGTLRMLAVNDAFERQYGYSYAEALALRLPDLYPAEEKADLAAFAGRLHGHAYAGEWHHVKRDGTRLAIVASSHDIDFFGHEARVAVITDITERKRAELALQESEAFRNQVFNGSRNPVVVMDPESGRFLDCNQAAVLAFGFPSREATLDKTPLDVSSAQQYDGTASAAKAQAHIREALEKGSVVFNWRGRRVNGEEWDAEVHLASFKVGARRLLQFTLLDITERLRAEAELRKLSRAIEQAPISIVVTDLSGAIEYVNPWFTVTTGYSAEEARGRNPRLLKSGETPIEVHRQMWGTITKGLVWRGEVRNRRKNGEVYDEMAVIAPVVDDGGRTTNYVALKEDVTARKRAESALQESEARFRAIAENSGDVIWLYDLVADRYRYVSPAVAKLLGYTPEETLAGKLIELLTPESLAATQRPLAQQLADLAAGDERARTRIYEVEFRRKDGGVVQAEVSAAVMADAAGRPVQMAGMTRDITERKRMEAALVESERAMAGLMANLPGMAYRCRNTPDWSMDIVSAGAFALTGYPVAELVANRPTYGDLILPAHRQAVWDAVQSGIADRRPYEMVYAIRTAGGTSKWVGERGAGVFAADGTLRFLEGFIFDITAQRAAEAALRESEHMLAAVFDNAVVGIAFVGADARIRRANTSLCTLLGYTEEELRTIEPETISHPEDFARQQELLAEVHARRSQGFKLEKRYIRKDGTDVWVRLGVSAVRDEAEVLDGLVTVVDDITERRRVREALEQFNTELELRVEARTVELAARTREIEGLLDSIPDTVLLCARNGTPVFSHLPRTEELPPFVAAGTEADDLPENPLVKEIAATMHALAQGGPQTIVREFDRELGGSPCSVEARATPIGSDQVLLLLRDITARRRAERDVLANLERARQLSEMKSQFISVASHEFRTPLAAAAGTLELFEHHAERMTPEKRAELLARMQRSLSRLTAIMNDVLIVSRADAGRVAIKHLPLGVGRFVQDILRELEDGDRQQHRFVFNQSGGPDVVSTDSNLLHHILTNLIGNAVRYSPAGTTVTVSLVHAERTFAVTVGDEGIGVPEAERARIFEPFVRGSNVGQIGGTGLGLNIVKRYVELLGGRVELLPTERGATFQVVVPRDNPTKNTPA